MSTFGFIGTGHIGSMLVEKLVQTGTIQSDKIWASNRSMEKLHRLADKSDIHIGSNHDVAALCDVIFICTKPLSVKPVLVDLAEKLTEEKLLISVAADVSLEVLSKLCSARISRAFPSIASKHLMGVTLLSYGSRITSIDRRIIENLFSVLGGFVEVYESDFAVLGDLTSCSPGYIAALMQEFAIAAARKGCSLDLAEQLLRQTLLGTGLVLREKSFQGLIEEVSTIGGITEQGIKVIQNRSPQMFDQLISATFAKHEWIKNKVDEN